MRMTNVANARRFGSRIALVCLGIVAACSSMSEQRAPYGSDEEGSGGSTGGGLSVGQGGGSGGLLITKGGAPGKGIFNDTREPVKLAKKPPALQGGTLLALRKGGAAFVADADRDRVLLIDLTTREVKADLPLGSGAEPGRAVEDAAGLVHVVLRGTGEVATIDVGSSELIARRAVCAAPRGIALHPQRPALVVACAEGSLVELPTAGGDATSAVSVDADLRDIVVQ